MSRKSEDRLPHDAIVATGNKILEDLRAEGFSDRDTLAIGYYIVLGSVVELANSTGAAALMLDALNQGGRHAR